MIRVRRPPAASALATVIRKTLAAQQSTADSFHRGDPRTGRAWKNFRRTKTGQATLAALASVFRGKCAFCERVGARTIDHYDPKERSPRRMFRWANLLLCCADCNQWKGSQFPFHNRRPALLDPTQAEPLEHYVWELLTGALGLVADAAFAHRGRVTRDQLRLDTQPLRDERLEKLNDVMFLFSLVVREQPTHPETVKRVQAALSEQRPYLGILRFVFRQPTRFTPLINAARKKLPQIDTWVQPWL